MLGNLKIHRVARMMERDQNLVGQPTGVAGNATTRGITPSLVEGASAGVVVPVLVATHYSPPRVPLAKLGLFSRPCR